MDPGYWSMILSSLFGVKERKWRPYFINNIKLKHKTQNIKFIVYTILMLHFYFTRLFQ